MIFIGDAHGHFDRLLPIVTKFAASTELVIQLGDMGLGFGDHLPRLGPHFSFIRGNHDAPIDCRVHPNYQGDYGALEIEGRTAFYLGGAYSIDWAWRLQYNLTHKNPVWWADEELSAEELAAAVALYRATRPDLVWSHECPSAVATEMLKPLLTGKSVAGLSSDPDYFNAKLDCATSRTARALQLMFDAHQPKDWVFGHYHIDRDLHINGTHFHCCAELSTYTLGDSNAPSKSPALEAVSAPTPTS